MKTLGETIDEVVRLRVKPNVLLYAFEASKVYFVVMLAMAFVLLPAAHFKSGLPIGGLMLAITLTGFSAIFSIFFVAVILAGRCMEFIITNSRVIVRASFMRDVRDNISIPIESIRRIEIRRYNARYGSVYFEWDDAPPLDGLPASNVSPRNVFDHSRVSPDDPAAGRSRHFANLVVRPGWAPIWLSMPSSSPPLSGFYGFRHFDTFAKLVAELQARA